jgi:hypothetical protein
MVSTALNSKGEYEHVTPAVLKYLDENNIHAVLTGHQKCGDFPVVLRANNSVIINSDTGYDPNDHQAVSAIEIMATDSRADIKIEGMLDKNLQASTQLIVSSRQGIEGDPYIGKMLPDHRVVQCRLGNGDYRLVFLQTPRVIEYSTLSANELLDVLNGANEIGVDRRRSIGEM